MNICIIGMNLTGLILSKALVNIGCSVHLFQTNKKKSNFSTRTIAISKSNFDFINNNIISLNKKKFHKIKKIRIFSNNKDEIVKFYNNGDNLFSLIELNNFFSIFYNNLKSNKLFKLKNFNESYFKNTGFKEDFNLVINCEKDNFLTRKYFSKKFKKKYDSIAYTALLYHKKTENFEAKQYFTNVGPLAFLPLTSKITSVVLSAYNNRRLKDQYFKNFILKFFKDSKVNKFSDFQKANLNFSLARKYYFKNILLFGDGLHQIHPLAGQGFNMTLRDLKILLNIIKKKIDNGFEVDSSCLKDFEETTKSKNFIFSEGINFIQDFFKVKRNFKENQLDQIIKKIGKNKKVNSFLINTADKGISAF